MAFDFLLASLYTHHSCYSGDDPRVLNGTADAYVAKFLPGGVSDPKAIKDEPEEDDDDDDGDEKPAKKRKAPAPKKEKVVKTMKATKQPKLEFGA